MCRVGSVATVRAPAESALRGSCLFGLRRRGEGGVAFADLFVFVWIVVSR